MELLYLVISLSSLQLSNTVRIWETVYLDQEPDCDRYIDKDDLEEGDIYMVKSDSWQGGTAYNRRPAECAASFNLGDRLISIRLVEVRCDEMLLDPFLAVYDNCNGQRRDILARFNCSSKPQITIEASTSCVHVYHYRGHIRVGYFFSLDIIAGEERIAFPVGGITAIVVGCMVGVLVVIKFFCVVTGYEDRIPKISILDLEEQKEILVAQQSPKSIHQVQHEPSPEETVGAAGGLTPGETISNEPEIYKLDEPMLSFEKPEPLERISSYSGEESSKDSIQPYGHTLPSQPTQPYGHTTLSQPYGYTTPSQSTSTSQTKKPFRSLDRKYELSKMKTYQV